MAHIAVAKAVPHAAFHPPLRVILGVVGQNLPTSEHFSHGEREPAARRQESMWSLSQAEVIIILAASTVLSCKLNNAHEMAPPGCFPPG